MTINRSLLQWYWGNSVAIASFRRSATLASLGTLEAHHKQNNNRVYNPTSDSQDIYQQRNRKQASSDRKVMRAPGRGGPHSLGWDRTRQRGIIIMGNLKKCDKQTITEPPPSRDSNWFYNTERLQFPCFFGHTFFGHHLEHWNKVLNGTTHNVI